MKKLKLIMLMMSPLLALGQKKDFIIKGKIGNLEAPAKAFLAYRDGTKVQADSAVFKNGTFTFKGTIGDPIRGNISISHDGKKIDMKKMDYIPFYVEAGVTEIISKDSISKSQIKGSKVNTDYKEFVKFSNPIDRKYGAVAFEERSFTGEQKADAAFIKAYQQKKEAIGRERDDLFLKFIKDHPDSFLSIGALWSYGGLKPDSAKVAALFYSLSKNVRNTDAGKEYAAQLEKRTPDNLGVKAPDFTMNDVNDKAVKLSDFKGKYVLVDFWASWCVPCRKENPNVLEAYKKYKDKNFTVLGVALERPNAKADWSAAIQKDGLPWTQVTDFNYFASPVARLYKVEAIPQNFLIDPSGKVIAKNLRGEELQKKLAEFLK